MDKNELLLQEGKRFHGHLGPYLVLGLKAGMLAREQLHATPFKMKAHVTLKLEKPVSCFIDGVQVSSGCTMGKRNITAAEGAGLTAVFTADQDSLTVSVKDSILQWIASLKITHENEEEVSRQLMDRPYEELFDF